MGRRYIIKSRKKYYVERNKKGQFMKWTRIGASLRADRRKKPTKNVTKPGYGHRGDPKPRKKSKR